MKESAMKPPFDNGGICVFSTRIRVFSPSDIFNVFVSVQDYTRSAYYCGDLVMINLLTGDIPTAYKYLVDLVHYSKGDVKVEAQELSEQIKMRMEMGVTEIPDELIQKAEIIVHKVSVGFRNRG